MDQIRAQAVETNNEGLGKGETKLSSFLTLHALRSMNLNYKILLLLALCICNAESEDPSGQFCNTDTNIGSGSQISANIDLLLDDLVSKTTSNFLW
nr:cysteine-rich repeat secretory protein 55 [Quercus suber]